MCDCIHIHTHTSTQTQFMEKYYSLNMICKSHEIGFVLRIIIFMGIGQEWPGGSM